MVLWVMDPDCPLIAPPAFARLSPLSKRTGISEIHDGSLAYVSLGLSIDLDCVCREISRRAECRSSPRVSRLPLRLPCSETEVAHAAFAEAGTLAAWEADGRSLLRDRRGVSRTVVVEGRFWANWRRSLLTTVDAFVYHEYAFSILKTGFDITARERGFALRARGRFYV